MINTHTENVVTMAEATHYRPLRKNGKRPHPRTLKRWADDGKETESGRRVYLEKVRMPSGPCTSYEAIDRFLAALQDKDAGPVVTKYDRTEEEAEKLLVSMGFAD